MENATKALLMAAGILIAIIILSLAIVVYGRISGFYQTKQNNISQEQLAAFNTEYSVYDRDDVTGFELVSLINKAIDFNQNKLDEGYTEMQITVTIPNDNASYNNNLFGPGTITYNGKNDNSNRKSLLKKIENMQELESNINSSDLTKLASSIYKFDDKDSIIQDFIKEVTGKKYDIGLDDIKKYADYLTFKRGTFNCTKMEYDKYGQIYLFEFTQVR